MVWGIHPNKKEQIFLRTDELSSELCVLYVSGARMGESGEIPLRWVYADMRNPRPALPLIRWGGVNPLFRHGAGL